MVSLSNNCMSYFNVQFACKDKRCKSKREIAASDFALLATTRRDNVLLLRRGITFYLREMCSLNTPIKRQKIKRGDCRVGYCLRAKTHSKKRNDEKKEKDTTTINLSDCRRAKKQQIKSLTQGHIFYIISL